MPKFAERIKYMEATADVVDGLFNSMTDPNIISFGGGAPAKESLPIDIVREIANEVLTKEGRGVEALQYGVVQGVYDLRKAVVEKLLPSQGVKADPSEVMIVAGGMESINIICQVFIDPGDVILVESPTFVHSVEVFDMFQAKSVSVVCDDFGMVMDDLEAKIKALHPKMIYVNPTFQNPSGKTLPLDRRKKMAELAAKYDVLVLEDDPYRELRYSGEPLPSIKSFDTSGNVILASSFSKIFSPGSRLGYSVTTPEIVRQLMNVKMATNSFTGCISQVLCAEYFNRGYFDEHLPRVCEIYRERRDCLIESIDKCFPAGTKRVFPDGGLFTWVELPGGINTTELLKEAKEEHLAFLAGEMFFVERDGRGRNCMRMSFGGTTPEKIRIGIEKLGALIKTKL